MADSQNVIEKRELTSEVIGTLHEWMDDYTSPWEDLHQRKIFVHTTDYTNGYMVVEVATVKHGKAVRTDKRYKVVITVENVKGT